MVARVWRRLRRHLSPRLVAWINRRRRLPQQPGNIDLKRLQLLQRVDREWLFQPERLPLVIRGLGLSDHHPQIMPAATHRWLGGGLQIMQYPNQFASYLCLLADRPVTSYVEIGVASGGSFAATLGYLEATGHQVKRALAIDPQYAPGVARLARANPAVTYLLTTSDAPEVAAALAEGPWDLGFIDGNHSYEFCSADFELLREAGTRIIAMHDIVDAGAPDVGRFWGEIRESLLDEYDFVEFTQQYPDVAEWTGATHFGIGVAIRKGNR